MKVLAIAIALSTAASAGAAIKAEAQRSIHIGVAGGTVLPVGILSDAYGEGPTGMVSLVMGSRDAPLGFRLDYQYDAFNGKTTGGTRVEDIHINSVTGNLVVPFRVGYAKPYLIGGGGFYPLRLPGAEKRENDWGANGGAGVGFQLPYTTLAAFLEVRYHAVNRSRTSPYHFVPITFGVLF
jgi:hypothetical protein